MVLVRIFLFLVSFCSEESCVNLRHAQNDPSGMTDQAFALRAASKRMMRSRMTVSRLTYLAMIFSTFSSAFKPKAAFRIVP